MITWTWLVGMIGVSLAYICRWTIEKISLRVALGFWIIFGGLVGGFLLQQWKYAGHPLQCINVHLDYYQNAKTTGVASYMDEKTTGFRYLFGDQGIFKVLRDCITGVVNLLFNPRNPFNKSFLGFHYSVPYSYFLFPFFIAGLLLTLLKKEYWSWCLMISFLNISASLLAEVRDPRLFYHLVPFFGYYFAFGFYHVSGFVIKKYSDVFGFWSKAEALR